MPFYTCLFILLLISLTNAVVNGNTSDEDVFYSELWYTCCYVIYYNFKQRYMLMSPDSLYFWTAIHWVGATRPQNVCKGQRFIKYHTLHTTKPINYRPVKYRHDISFFWVLFSNREGAVIISLRVVYVNVVFVTSTNLIITDIDGHMPPEYHLISKIRTSIRAWINNNIHYFHWM